MFNSITFIGPFTISQVVNPNAYRLELPESFGIHPTVNISRLKRFVDGSLQFPSREVEEWRPTGEKVRDENGELEFEVERILAQRGGGKRRQFLVKWQGYPLWEATWEREANLENAKQKLAEFHQRVESSDTTGMHLEPEQLSAMLAEPDLSATFKGVESVTVQKKEKHGVEELKQWLAGKGISLLEAMQSLLDEL